MPSANEPIVIACGADDTYAMPLAVTLRSLLDATDPARAIVLYVLDGGMTSLTKERLATLCGDRCQLNWLTPDLRLVADYPVSHHISTAAYLRLLLPKLLPDDVHRILYLDSDMLVRRDVSLLWDAPLGECGIAAVQDMAAPWIDAQISAPNFEAATTWLSAARPVANYEALGLNPTGRYFNSGLLVMDIDLWRSEGFAEQVFRCLEEHREHVLWWDQYALNVVFADRWHQLDPRWNQGSHVFVYPTWEASPLTQQMFESVRHDPWIIHFCSPAKPWHADCDHPLRHEYFEVLDRTPWQGWRPQPVKNAPRATLGPKRRKGLRKTVHEVKQVLRKSSVYRKVSGSIKKLTGRAA
ncbi:glycosyltransferase family 8 protein [Aeoliella sp. SH292]|uniref:glycosyltransferase family 8 protein n=1 Tax=Aeoliella sp. SH292 TaxID=3454464 RepID=UPI003F9481D6